MNKTFYVLDYLSQKNDDEAITDCLKERATFPGPATIIFSGKDYCISHAVLIPSETTILVDGCTISQANFTFDNVFRGDNLVLSGNDPYGLPLEVKSIKNIKILGKNGAKIHGPKKNPLFFNYMTKKEEEPLGDFWGWRTLTISLSKCDGFEVGGLSFENARCWTMSFDICTNGYIHDICFDTDVKNGDGIDFRSGCHNCLVENISGYTGDDTVACSALSKGRIELPMPSSIYPGEYYLYPMEPTRYLSERSESEKDISNITIRNVNTGGKHHGVICLAARGCKVYNIKIENIRENPMNIESPHREATVKIYTSYGGGYKKGDIHDIYVKNVTSTYSDSAVYCNAEVENITLEGISGSGKNVINLDFPEDIKII
ncbi:MAG: hypothetical protein IJF32_07795 [Oscillospiraceae bacterium]|nr:hypothetical protein [Oscillospiraceae bacterium]MBQ7119824.1 hypothetical protein [Oscillospiraceae bacterium]